MSAPGTARGTPRVRRLMALAAVLAIGTSVLGSALVPYLLTHYPLALLLLAPEPRHVVLATGVLPAPLVIGATLLRRVLGLLALYGFGWAYGAAALTFIEKYFGRIGRFLRWVEGKLGKHGVPVIALAPTPSVVTLSGIAGVPLRWALLAMTLGQLFWVTVTWAFGEWIGALVEPVVAFLGAHVLEATAVTVAVVLLYQLWAYLRRERTPQPIGEPSAIGEPAPSPLDSAAPVSDPPPPS